MSKVDHEIIKQIEELDDKERKKVFNHLKARLKAHDAIVLGKAYD